MSDDANKGDAGKGKDSKPADQKSTGKETADKKSADQKPAGKETADKKTAAKKPATKKTTAKTAAARSKAAAASILKDATADVRAEYLGGNEQGIIKNVLETHGEEAVTDAFKETAEQLSKDQKAAQTWLNGNKTAKKEFDAIASAEAELRSKFQEKNKDGKWVNKEGVDNKKLEAAQQKVKDAKEAFDKRLADEKAPEKVKNFLSSKAKVQEFNKVGWAAGVNSGKVKALGFTGALKSNLGFAEEVINDKGDKGRRVGMGVVKWAGVGAGLYAAKDALFRGSVVDAQTGEEVPRSMATRAIELAAGVGVAGLSALGGKATRGL